MKTWIDRYAAEGEAGLIDRSSRPHTHARRGPAPRSSSSRRAARQASVAVPTGSAPSSACRPGRCRRSCAATGCRGCASLDPMTGEVIRAARPPRSATNATGPASWCTWTSRSSGGSPTAAAGAPTAAPTRRTAPTSRPIGFDYVHSLVDDHSRLAYSEVLPDEKGPTCAGVPAPGPSAYFAAHGITRIERLMTDNAWAYRYSLRDLAPQLGIKQKFIKPALPLAEREGRTTQPHPAHRVGLPPGLHHQRRTRRRPCALARALQHSTPPQRTRRTTTVSRLLPT